MSNRIGTWARRGVCASALAAALLATAACSAPNPFQQTTLNTDWAYSDRGDTDQSEFSATTADDHPYEVSITKTEVVSDPEHGKRYLKVYYHAKNTSDADISPNQLSSLFSAIQDNKRLSSLYGFDNGTNYEYPPLDSYVPGGEFDSWCVFEIKSDSPVQVQLPKSTGSKDLLIDQKVDVR